MARQRHASLAELLLTDVRREPGVTIADLAHRHGVTANAIRYHVRRLGRRSLVRGQRWRKSMHVFPTTPGVRRPSQILASKDPGLVPVLEFVQAHPGRSTSEIQRALARSQGVPASTTHYRLTTLRRLGLVTATRQGRSVHYSGADVPLPAEPVTPAWGRSWPLSSTGTHSAPTTDGPAHPSA